MNGAERPTLTVKETAWHRLRLVMAGVSNWLYLSFGACEVKPSVAHCSAPSGLGVSKIRVLMCWPLDPLGIFIVSGQIFPTSIILKCKQDHQRIHRLSCIFSELIRSHFFCTQTSHLFRIPTNKSAFWQVALLAKDGIYIDDFPRFVDRVSLPPGGRAELAVRCPTQETEHQVGWVGLEPKEKIQRYGHVEKTHKKHIKKT